jgi:hypothetical protein
LKANLSAQDFSYQIEELKKQADGDIRDLFSKRMFHHGDRTVVKIRRQ